MELGIDVDATERNKLLISQSSGLITYQEYRLKIEELHRQKMVTGHEQSEALLNYSELNTHRMNRWDKHYSPSASVEQVMLSAPPHWHVVAIAEGWCGDAAQIIPAIYKMVSIRADWKFSVILRDEHPEWMDLFLTNDARAIPIVVAFDENGRYQFHWGPRPAEATHLIADAKSKGIASEVWKNDLHKWYAINKQAALEAEWIAMMSRFNP